MINIIKIGKELIAQGEDFVVARVIRTEGSTPRKKGALLLMTKDGRFFGTVGGGMLEARVEAICRETFATKESKIWTFRLTPEDQQGIDMRCGGDASVSVEYIDHTNPSNFEEDAPPASAAYIFGAGHVGKEIAWILKFIGFETIVLDDRPEFANAERFPDADRIVVIEDFKNAFKGIETDEDSYVIIVTRGHSADYDVLKEAMQRPAAYIGMIGSKTKVASIMERIRRDGFSENAIAAVYSPIGLSIGAETPEEIAVSVAAEIIRVRSRKTRLRNQSCCSAPGAGWKDHE